MKKSMEYTCVDYRAEMILLGLKRRLHLEELSEEERKEIILEIEKFEAKTGLD
jgi:hypothetical protein